MPDRYDIGQTYAWNYRHAPDGESTPGTADRFAPLPGIWDFCGRPAPSPLGIAAGPLLNGRC